MHVPIGTKFKCSYSLDWYNTVNSPQYYDWYIKVTLSILPSANNPSIPTGTIKTVNTPSTQTGTNSTGSTP